MEILSKVPERLEELMMEKGLNASSLSKKLGVSVSTVTRYLKGERLPTFQNFVKLLDFFNCSADFLIGLTDFPTATPTFRAVLPFKDRFRALLDECKLSQYELHRRTNLSYDDFNKWLKGLSYPYVDNLAKLAKAFNCTVDYLLGREV